MNIVRQWLEGAYDNDTKSEIERLIRDDPKELEDAFYKSLEFGTGGLRGVTGTGPNRVNRYTIGMATQGLSNYILKSFPNRKDLSVAISFDCRNFSREFAEITADVFSSNGIRVYLFRELRPVPQLSFAVRHLGCVAGVMITASHNPKEYNGYKVYWEDGAQVISPHDTNIINEVNKVGDPSKVKFKRDDSVIFPLGDDIDNKYLDAIISLSLSPDAIKEFSDFGIVYTPLHGTGVKMVPEILKRAGFKNVITVKEQEEINGNFPTVKSPNPEEPSALKMALDLAEIRGAKLVLATDPDADRIGVATRDKNGKMILLNGNQTATLLTYYLLRRFADTGRIKRGEENERFYMVKTIVTTDLLSAIASSFGVRMYNVLTGFKYIAAVVEANQGKGEFIGGGEESFGFNAGEYVRDKDAVLSALLISETAVWAASKGKSLYELLIDIYIEFGLFKERLVSVTKKGIDGVRQINDIMAGLRENPLLSIDGTQTLLVHDYLKSETIDLVSDLRYKIDLPSSDVLQYVSSDNSMISVRPSGTEPKIKYYLAVRSELNNIEEYEHLNTLLEKKLDRLQSEVTDL